MSATHLADTHRLQAALGDRYVVEREVARGGWASVYRARDRKHDRIVAVKVFHPELAHTLGPERFLQEIHLVAGFQHPYVVPLHDSGETAESLYYVMPFVEGDTLRDRLAREGRLPIDDALAIARDVLAALAYAHDRGVLHRDVKPENVLLSGGHALVADFGIARAVSKARGDRLSRPGIAVGTPAYMAPEQALGGEDADGRSDVYAVAAMVYEMLAGRPPYPDATLSSVVDRHIDDPRPADLATLRPDLPADIPAAVMRGLALMPDDRWPTATAFAEALTVRSTPVAPTWTPAETAARARHMRRARSTRVVLALGVLAAAIAIAWGVVEGRRGGFEGPARIAVFPFTVRSGAEYAYLAEGMVDLLSADLDGAGEIRAVDAHAVLGATGGADSTPLSPERARVLAERLGATRFVMGSVTESGGRLRMLATLYDRGAPPRALVHADADGEQDRLLALIDELATELIAGERGGPGQRLTRLAAVTTHSLPALKVYLRGEDQLRRSQADSAMTLFEEALEIDSTFGLAAYRRAVAANWAADFTIARQAGEQALRLGDRLGPNDRQLLQAFLAWHHGDASRAEQLYRAILADRPDDVEAWYQLGEVLFHYGPLRGQPITSARAPLERARALDPKTGHATLHLLDIAAREGDAPRFDSLLATMRVEGAILLRRRAARDLALGTPDERAATLAALGGATDGTVIVTVGGLANFRQDLASAAEAARVLVAPTRSEPARAYGHVLLAQLAWGRGRPREAARHLDQAATLDSVLALEWRAFGAAIRWLPTPLKDVEGMAARLRAGEGTASTRAPTTVAPLAVHDSVHEVVREYLVAQLAIRLGDAIGAQQLAARLDSTVVARTEGSLPRDLAYGIRGSLAVARGDDAAALAAFDSMPARSALERIANSPFFALTLERWTRAELLRAAGRSREAAGWYESMGEWRPDIPFVVVARLRAGQLREAAGDIAGAAEAYRMVLREWRDCEAEVRPLRDEAAAGLARLTRLTR